VRIETGGFCTYRLDPFDRVACRLAAVAGIAAMASKGELAREEVETYSTMLHLFLLQPREVLKLQSISSVRDLMVPQGLSTSLNMTDVLPEDFGVFAPRFARWAIAEMMEQGLRAAQLAEAKDSSPKSRAIHAIAEEARLFSETRFCPDTAVETVPLQFRRIFFDVGPAADVIDEEIKSRVFRRFQNAVDGHTHLDSEKYASWIRKGDNLYRQIAKRKKDGTPIDQRMVRHAMVELAYDSLKYVGKAVHEFMSIVQSSLPPSSAAEERLFRAVNLSVPELDDLPLILVHTQWPELDLATLRILNQLDKPVEWGQILRMIETYATIAERRRVVERAKKKSGGRVHSLTENAQPTTPFLEPLSLEDDVTRELLERDGIECACGTLMYWYRLSMREHFGVFHFEATCSECGATQWISASKDELRRRRADVLC
jgi:hypothetical protein